MVVPCHTWTKGSQLTNMTSSSFFRSLSHQTNNTDHIPCLPICLDNASSSLYSRLYLLYILVVDGMPRLFAFKLNKTPKISCQISSTNHLQPQRAGNSGTTTTTHGTSEANSICFLQVRLYWYQTSMECGRCTRPQPHAQPTPLARAVDRIARLPKRPECARAALYTHVSAVALSKFQRPVVLWARAFAGWVGKSG